MTHLISKNKKALSLLEVIVVLAVISFTMIASMTVVLRASAMIKNNEIQDTANDILVQAFELIRSPDDIKVLDGITRLTQAGVTTSFSLEFQDGGSRKGYLNRVTSAFNSMCDSNNVYDVPSLGASARPFPICARIDITPVSVTPGTIDRYNVIITLFYNLSTGPVQEDYLLNRYGGFVPIT